MQGKDALVAILKDKQDLLFVEREHWYRIPVKSAPEIIRNGTAKYIAWYQPKIFGNEAFAVRRYAEIADVSVCLRRDLLPEEATSPKANDRYYKISFNEVLTFPQPIVSARHRRLLFIPTTREKLFLAREINEVFSGSNLEERLWHELRTEHIPAEREYIANGKAKTYHIDFAIFCKNARLAVECDGDSYHLATQDVHRDKARDVDLQTRGWIVYRFPARAIERYLHQTIGSIKESIAYYGGTE